jgi:hypothetical protein
MILQEILQAPATRFVSRFAFFLQELQANQKGKILQDICQPFCNLLSSYQASFLAKADY